MERYKYFKIECKIMKRIILEKMANFSESIDEAVSSKLNNIMSVDRSSRRS